MVTININTIYLIFSILVGLVGWFLAFYNHSLNSRYRDESDEAIKKLIEAQTQDKERLGASWTTKYKELQTQLSDKDQEHAREISVLIEQQKIELEIRDQSHETELTELSELADNKFKELEKGLQADVELYEKYIENIGNLIKVSKDVIDQVDSRGSYRTDDELETFFEALKSIQLELDKFQIEISNEST